VAPGCRVTPVLGSIVCGIVGGGTVEGLADGESMPGVRVVGDGVVGPGSGETVPVPGVVPDAGGGGDVTPLPGIVPGLVLGIVPGLMPGDEPGNVPLGPPMAPPVVPPPVCARAGPTASDAIATRAIAEACRLFMTSSSLRVG
jgi:hypothetical protein